MQRLREMLMELGFAGIDWMPDKYLEKDWKRLSDLDVACPICGEPNLMVFAAHSNSTSFHAHYLCIFCMSCKKLQDSVSLPGQKLEEIKSKESYKDFLALNCSRFVQILSNQKLDLSLDEENNVPMPIVYDSKSRNHVVPVLTLGEYFTQDFTLSIPPWQREYTWSCDREDGAVSVLLDDLQAFVNDPRATEYLLGAVILCDTDKSDVAYLIDGQQRTVTLTLLLVACNQYLKQADKWTAEDYELRMKLKSVLEAGDANKFKARVNFSQPKANDILTQIYDWMNANSAAGEKFITETDTYSKTQNNLLAVISHFKKILNEGAWFKDEDLKLALSKILDGVKLIQLRLNSTSEAIQVYDRINHRGMELSDADLIKNQLFQKVDDEDFDKISESWQAMVASLRSCKSTKFQDPKYLIRTHAWTIWPEKTTYDGLADKYLEYYFGEKAEKPVEPVIFAQELEELANSLVELLNANHSKHGHLPLLHVVQQLGSIQHYTMLLAGRHITDTEAYLKLYQQVTTRTIWYVLSKERPPEFEAMVPKWSNAIYKAGKSVTVEKLEEIYLKYAFGSEDEVVRDKKIASLNADLMKQMSGWKVSNSADKKKIRAALALMSWWTDQICNNSAREIESYFETRKKNKKGWDIEHIGAKAYADPKIPEDIKDSIGNLALLCPDDQRGAKNASPYEKIEIYTHSQLVLSKSVTGHSLTPIINRNLEKLYSDLKIENSWSLENWSKDSISAREKFYLNFVTEIVNMKLPVPIV